MEIFILVLLYYLSQNPNFSESIKPIMSQIKDSEQMLCFLKDLSKFAETFNFKVKEPKEEPAPTHSEKKEENKNPQSPTSGIADEFIQNILDSYFKK
jgi:hypothetical protein